MTVTLIEHSAEDILYANIIAKDRDGGEWYQKAENIFYLHCRFFQIAEKPDLIYIKEACEAFVENERELLIYACNDGDLIFQWSNDRGEYAAKIVECIKSKYKDDIENYLSFNEFFHESNWIDGLNKLKGACLKKLNHETKNERKLASYFANDQLVATLKKTIQLIKVQRSFRTSPHILIVEDQAFSQKMLVSILKDYRCSVVSTTGEALLKYMEKCPDIVFLDLGLPDLSGHSFAQLLKKIDDESYVVVVSANHYEQDITQAKENNARGFISKPFQKDLILNAVEKFKKQKRRG